MLWKHEEDQASFGEIFSGKLAVRVAQTREEVRSAQKLRYKVFYEEMGGVPSAEMHKQAYDFDAFDDYCDHLLVLDYDLPEGDDRVVGTYRLLRRSRMRDLRHFYTETEFDISAIKREEGDILELGRSCVDMRYRNRSVMQLLLRGIGAYITKHDIKLMFGCASFFGADPEKHILSLSYLYHYHLAPEKVRAVALPGQYVEMNLMAREEINVKRAFAALPPLIKGYLRINGYIGMGGVIDPHFNTLDVGIVVKTDLVSDKYANRYSTPSSRKLPDAPAHL